MGSAERHTIEGAGVRRGATAVDTSVGNRVRFRRMAMNMSQSALGEAVGVTFQQVQKYEKGTNRIGAGRLSALATVLQVPVAYFFERTEQSADVIAFAADDASTDRATHDLIRAFADIADKDIRKSLVNLTESLAKVLQRVERM